MSLLNAIGYGIIAFVIVICVIVVIAASIHGRARECSICEGGLNPPYPDRPCPICGGAGKIQ